MALTASTDASRRGRVPPVRLAVPALGLLWGTASIGIIASLAPGVTTYAAASPRLAAAALVAGLGLIAVATAAHVASHAPRIGSFATLLGIAWLAPIWVGWQGHVASGLVRSIGMVGVPFLVPVLAHLVLAWPGGHVATATGRLIVAAGYASAVTVSLGRGLIYDPFFDLYCWSNCTTNVFLVHNDPPLARALRSFGLWAAAALGVVAAIIAIYRLAAATAAGRAPRWYVLAPACAAALSETAYATALLHDPLENPQHQTYQTLYLLRAAALTLLAAGFASTLVRARRQRLAVARVAQQLAAAPPLGSLSTVLAHALGDDTLDVAYWLTDTGGYVDASGRTVDPVPTRNRAVTSIRRHGEPVAVVVHGRALQGEHRLEHEIGSAARLAIDNERLRVALLIHLDRLRASRARIVQTADETRRRLERDLHDGAQQSLLAATYELRLGRDQARAAGDEALAATLDAAVDEAQAALAELRDIAHGIFPAILDEAGLGPALWTLADRAGIPVNIGDVPQERLANGVERAAYVVVTEAVEAATAHEAAQLSVAIERAPGAVVVQVDGVPGAPYDHLVDRVGALGGHLTRTHGRLRAEIPCD